jgi:quercetin dioxygenase-like cupin family protein
MATKRAQATPTTQVDNERVTVTEWRFAPGGETGWHRHEHDYVVVPMMDGKLLLETANGESVSELKCGKSYFKNAGVEHNVVNPSEAEFVFVEIEIKP